MRVFGSFREVFEGYPGRMLVVLSLGRGSLATSRFMISVLLPTIIVTLGITPFEAGIALSAMGVTSALLQYPGGRFADDLNPKTVILGSLGAGIVGLVVISSAVTYPLFVLACLVLGVGQGLSATPTISWLSSLFTEEQRGRMFGVHETSIDLGGITAAVVAPIFIAIGLWQGTFLPLLLVVVPLFYFVYRWGEGPIVIEPVPIELRATAARLFANRRILVLLGVYVLFTFTLSGFTGFLPALLQADHGFSPAVASALFGLVYASGLVYKPSIGLLTDRFDPLLMATTVMGIGAVGIFVLLTAPTLPLVAIGVALYAVGHKGFFPVVNTQLFSWFPEASSGADFGVFRTIQWGVGTLAPVYVGYVAGRWNYTLAFYGFIGLFAMAGLLTLGLYFAVKVPNTPREHPS